MATSVWIDHFRDPAERPQVRLLRDVEGSETVLVGDSILLEVLQGAADAANAAKLERAMRRLAIVELLNGDLAALAAARFRTLRGRGATLRGNADLVIGTWCIATGVPLLHNDRDFDAMERHLGLRAVPC